MPDFTVTKPGKRQSAGPAGNANAIKRTKTTIYTVPTNNQFAVLEDIMDADGPSTSSQGGTGPPPPTPGPSIAVTTNETKTNKDNQKKEKRPPPLVIHGHVNEHHEFVDKIRNICKSEFHIKYTRQNTNIYTTIKEDWEKLSQYLQGQNTEHHTFTHHDNKTHAFVLKGIQFEMDATELAGHLAQSGLETRAVYLMRNTRRPLYLVVTDSAVTLRKIQAQVRHIYYTRVAWDRYINNKKLTQCHRCQGWRHATSNCHALPACLKCAEQHQTRDCTKPAEEAAKCVNCGGAHPANNVQCPIYLEALRQVEAKQQKRQEPVTYGYIPGDYETNYPALYRPAHQPMRNVWEDRAAAMAAQQANRSRAPNANQGPPPAANQRPPLPSTSHNSAHVHSPQPNTDYNENNENNHSSDFQDLIQEFRELNEMVNLSAILAAVRDLKQMMRGCRGPLEKLEAYNSFIKKLPSYGI